MSSSILSRGAAAAVASMLFFLTATAGCGPRQSFWAQTLAVEGPEVVGENHLVWLDRTTDSLMILDTAGAGVARRVFLEPTTRGMATGGGKVVVAGGTGTEPVLQIVSVNGGTEPVRVDLGGEAFDKVWMAPGAGHAVLTHSMEAQGGGGVAARNLNRVAVVTLSSSPELQPVLLQTDALAPTDVLFSKDGTMAAVLLDAAIALLDVREPSRNVRVPLRLPGGQRLLPKKAVFSPNADYLYVKASGTADLLVIEIGDGEAMSASVNFLFVPGALTLEDVAVPAGEEFEEYVAALFRRSTDSVAALLHASGDASLGRQVKLSRPAAKLLDMGDGCMIVHGTPLAGAFARWIAGWEMLTSRVDERELQGAYVDLPVVVGGHAFFRHDEVAVSGAGKVAGLTSVLIETDGPWLRVRPSAIMLLGEPAAATGHVASYFVAVDIDRRDSGAAPGISGATTDKTGAIVSVSGDDLAIDGLTLDDRVKEMGVVGDHLYVVHDRLLGDVTLVPTGDLSREGARRFDGLLLTDILDAAEERR